jgi:hypothetical protein
MDVWADVEFADDRERVKVDYLAWLRSLDRSKCDVSPQRFGVERDSTQDTWERPNGGRSWVR